MNYFAHGRRFVEEPYFLAGTAVPDWLCVVDRRVRVRSKQALPWVDDADPRVAALARGVVQHHRDDAWFHETRAFAELQLEFSKRIRDHLPADEGFRPSFLGHILVEMLLDDELIRQDRARLEGYYRSLESLDADVIERAVNRMATQTTSRLAYFVGAFCRERFLWDYCEDGKLLTRLNQVMRRVGLAPLPPSLVQVLPELRDLVSARWSELLPAA